MDETLSQLDSQKDESKLILSSDPAIDSKTTIYSNTASNTFFSSCVPCKKASNNGGFVTCPTCQGSGEIPRALEKQLVALIPYGDQRLKPRHTKLFVFLAVLICFMTSTLIIFFLFPRSTVVQSAGLNFSTVALNETGISLNLTNVLKISNHNYCPITVTQLAIEVLHLSLVVGQVSKNLLLPIGPLASEQMFYAVASNIRDENTYKICTWQKIKVHHVLLYIQGTLTYSYLSHSEQVVFQSYEYVDCRGNSSVPHLLTPLPP
ncbi:PREDICTED: transmembrane protein 106A [Chrysochloris asiatica]|uniref:Transmembrane protein 106A n=1 Tax=Chrysochloris asiatica TaxID=185453 RepID=A0A9B0SYN3_CHRAS|nr:PREDICTED: transmembrane protein 106A [Chrysochloris asiatica]